MSLFLVVDGVTQQPKGVMPELMAEPVIGLEALKKLTTKQWDYAPLDLVGQEYMCIETLYNAPVMVLKRGDYLMRLEADVQGVSSSMRILRFGSPSQATVGSVIRPLDGRKYVVIEPHTLPVGAVVTASYPHGDDDYSYRCTTNDCLCQLN